LYCLKDKLILMTWNRTVTGLSIGSSHIWVLAPDADSAVIGAEVAAALDANQFGVPMPEPRPGKPSTLAVAAGFKSDKSFELSVTAACVVVELEIGIFVAELRKSKGPGFDTRWKERVSSERDPASLGRTVSLMLKLGGSEGTVR
jgi:hypothetical protein